MRKGCACFDTSPFRTRQEGGLSNLKGFSVPSIDIHDLLETLEPALSSDALFFQNYCIAANTKKENTIILGKLNKAIQLSHSSALYRMKGDCLTYMKRYKEAEQAYWDAHYMVPTEQRTKARLVSLYLKQGKKKEAQRIAHKILIERVKFHNIDTYILHQEMKNIISIP